MRCFIFLLAVVALSSCTSVPTETKGLTGKWEATAFSSPYGDGSRLLYQFHEGGKLEISFLKPGKQPETLVGEYQLAETNVVMTFPDKGTRTFSCSIDGDSVMLTDLTYKDWVKCRRTR